MDRPLGYFAKVRVQLGERLFDRVEIGAAGRQEQKRAPALSIAARTAGVLWLARLSMMTTSARLSSGTRTWVT